MCECIVSTAYLKLGHDWRQEWTGARLRRVGNNWRTNNVRMQQNKACSVVLECMHVAGRCRVNLRERAAPPEESELQQETKPSVTGEFVPCMTCVVRQGLIKINTWCLIVQPC